MVIFLLSGAKRDHEPEGSFDASAHFFNIL